MTEPIYSHENSWNYLEELISLKLPIQESWKRIIEFHRDVVHKECWQSLLEFDLIAEQVELKNGLEYFVTDAPIPENIIALWIGIFLANIDGNEYYAIYLSGSENFDKGNVDWAIDPAYNPENNYGIPEVLNEIRTIIKAKNTDNFDFLDWILPISYCALTIDEIVRNMIDKSIFLKSKDELSVTLGYDNGDFINLTPIK